MRSLLIAVSTVGLVGCPKSSPPEAPRPGKVEVLFLTADGEARVGRRQRTDDPCDWELVVVEGNGWGPWARTPGRPEILPGPGGELVAWSTCGTPELTWMVLADSDDLRAQVPPRLDTVAWVDENTVHITGFDDTGQPVSPIRFTRVDGDWQTVSIECVPLGIDALGQTVRSGEGVDLLLLDDLNGDDNDEMVVEEPDSCGTARCTATVYTPCANDRPFRPMGTLDHRDGVRLGESAESEWQQLKTLHAEGADVWEVREGKYVRVGAE